MKPRTMALIRALRQFQGMGWRFGWSEGELTARLWAFWRTSTRRQRWDYFVSIRN
jgi:methionine salvage enolase-phosphatase E1